MNETAKHCYPTIDSIKEWQRKIEIYSGLDCVNIRDLDKNATYEDYLNAKEKDSAWFGGFIDELSNLI